MACIRSVVTSPANRSRAFPFFSSVMNPILSLIKKQPSFGGLQ